MPESVCVCASVLGPCVCVPASASVSVCECAPHWLRFFRMLTASAVPAPVLLLLLLLSHWQHVKVIANPDAWQAAAGRRQAGRQQAANVPHESQKLETDLKLEMPQTEWRVCPSVPLVTCFTCVGDIFLYICIPNPLLPALPYAHCILCATAGCSRLRVVPHFTLGMLPYIRQYEFNFRPICPSTAHPYCVWAAFVGSAMIAFYAFKNWQ